MGTIVTIEAPDPVLTELRTVLGDLASAAAASRHLRVEPAPDHRYRLLDGGTVVRADIEPSILAATVVWHLNTMVPDTDAHLVIHAGCVAAEGAVLLPGGSGAGKSTLVAACVEQGLTYLSDEYAVVDLATGSMVPYPKPLSLDEHSAGGERLLPSSQLRATSVATPLAPSAIIFPRYSPDEPPSLTTLEPGLVVLALAAHTTNLATLSSDALPWLVGLALACPASQLTHHDASGAVPRIRAAASTSGEPVHPAATIGPVTQDTTTVPVGDELAVLDASTGTVHLLNTAASFVWTCVPEAESCSDLAEVVLALAPPGALERSTVDTTIRRLVDMGLLTDAPDLDLFSA